MKKAKILLLAFTTGLGLSIYGNVHSTDSASAETIVCPGSGERCAQVDTGFLGIKFWKKKEEGGPGIIVVE
jgi:hypothetical protein